MPMKMKITILSAFLSLSAMSMASDVKANFLEFEFSCPKEILLYGLGKKRFSHESKGDAEVKFRLITQYSKMFASIEIPVKSAQAYGHKLLGYLKHKKKRFHINYPNPHLPLVAFLRPPSGGRAKCIYDIHSMHLVGDKFKKLHNYGRMNLAFNPVQEIAESEFFSNIERCTHRSNGKAYDFRCKYWAPLEKEIESYLKKR